MLKAETVVTLELTTIEDSTLLRLTHAGFPDEESRNNHEQAWPIVLAQQEEQLSKLYPCRDINAAVPTKLRLPE